MLAIMDIHIDECTLVLHMGIHIFAYLYTYLTSEVVSTIWHVILYFSHTKIDLPPLKELFNILNEHLQKLCNSTVSDSEGELNDAVNNTNNIEQYQQESRF